jgi:hypothetical protein
MTDINQTRKDARVAGVLYLLIALIAPIGLLYVPGQLIVTGNAAATADHLRAAEWLLRLGIASELFHQIIGIFLMLALYRVFKAVDEHLTWLMVILGMLLSLPIVFVNVLNEIAALILVGNAKFLSVFDRPQRDALAYLFMRLHGQGIQVAAIFWGLWLFPFGMLVIRSRFIPRTLGVLLIVAGAAYLAASFNTLLLPRPMSLVGDVAGILEIGEVPIIFWLLIWGAKAQPAPALAPAV